MSAALLASLALAFAATPEELLLQVEARTEYLEARTPSLAEVVFERVPEGTDPDFPVTYRVGAAYLRGPGSGAPVVAAPAHRLEGVERATVVFFDGATSPATVLPPHEGADVPLAVLRLDDPKVLEGRRALGWARPEEVVEDARGWVVERASEPGPDGVPTAPVLVDTVLGPEADPPLRRFRTVPLRLADGLPVLDAEGRVLCVVFRAVLASATTSLCAPRDAAFRPSPTPVEVTEEEEAPPISEETVPEEPREAPAPPARPETRPAATP